MLGPNKMKALCHVSFVFCLMLGLLFSARGQTSPVGQSLFAGKWKGKLHSESQDSYRGNNAKGQHHSADVIWVFEISPDEKTITHSAADWKGPKQAAKIVHKDNLTITWHESEKQSAELKPKSFYDAQGRLLGTGGGITPDVDADWTIHLRPDGTARVHCNANREDIYARITDLTITGTLTRIK